MEPRPSVIEKRLQNIRRIIAVASGKGGVGKSLLASMLALSLAKKGRRVGLLDLDVYGPSAHIILGVKGKFPKEEKGIIPPTVHGIKFMSLVYFTEDKPAPFRGNAISDVILELLAIIQWGSLEYLVIDMPPGIGDETLDVIKYLPSCEFLVVTTPSKVAMGAVSKLLAILQELKKPILGVVENMTMKPSLYIRHQVNNLGIPYLGGIAFDEDLEDAIGIPKRLETTTCMNDISRILHQLNL